MIRSSLVLGAAALLGACAAGVPQQLTALARSDLRCDANLMFTRLDAQTRVASGCGKEATYALVCDGEDECAWVRELGVRRAGG